MKHAHDLPLGLHGDTDETALRLDFTRIDMLAAQSFFEMFDGVRPASAQRPAGAGHEDRLLRWEISPADGALQQKAVGVVQI